MNARELAITVLGLIGTFCLPWPGEPGPGDVSLDEEVRAVYAAKASQHGPQLACFVP